MDAASAEEVVRYTSVPTPAPQGGVSAPGAGGAGGATVSAPSAPGTVATTVVAPGAVATVDDVTSTSAPGPVMDEDTATTTAPPTDPGQVDGDAPGESQQQLPPELDINLEMICSFEIMALSPDLRRTCVETCQLGQCCADGSCPTDEISSLDLAARCDRYKPCKHVVLFPGIAPVPPPLVLLTRVALPRFFFIHARLQRQHPARAAPRHRRNLRRRRERGVQGRLLLVGLLPQRRHHVRLLPSLQVDLRRVRAALRPAGGVGGDRPPPRVPGSGRRPLLRNVRRRVRRTL